MGEFNNQVLRLPGTPCQPATRGSHGPVQFAHMATRGRRARGPTWGRPGVRAPAHLVGIGRCEAVALQEEGGLGEQLVQEHTGIALGVWGMAAVKRLASGAFPAIPAQSPHLCAPAHLAGEQHQASVWVIAGQQG